MKSESVKGSDNKVAFAVTIISVICFSVLLVTFGLLQAQLNAAEGSLQERMSKFKYTARGIWQDIMIVQSQGRVKRQGYGNGGGASDDAPQCTSCVQLQCPPGPPG